MKQEKKIENLENVLGDCVNYIDAEMKNKMLNNFTGWKACIPAKFEKEIHTALNH